MQTKLPDGSIMVAGRATRDAEFKVVGEKQSRLCKVGLAVGKRKDTTTIYVEIAAWHALASVLAAARKGDAVLVVGRLTEPREYNGKSYQDLEAEFLSVASVSAAAEAMAAAAPRPSGPPTPAGSAAQEDDDGELPF